MILKCGEGGVPHPEGIFAAVCVDVIDMGLRRVLYRGEEKWVPQLRLVFETVEGEARWLSRTLTASLHPKSRLSEVLGKWRGKPFMPGEEFDTKNLIGVSATLVVSHQQKLDGSGAYASIDAVSRATRRVMPSGTYNPDAAREKIKLYDAKNGQGPAPVGSLDRAVTNGRTPVAQAHPDPDPAGTARMAARERELPQGTQPVGVVETEDDEIPF